MTQEKIEGSGDCSLLNLLWTKLLWNPTSKYYLPTIIKSGLDDSTFGIKIPPFSTIDIGTLPEITMFKEPVLGYMKLNMINTKLSGLDTVSKGTLGCTDTDPAKTDFTITLPFGKLDYSGGYGVDAGGGIGGCAIAAGAAILGGKATDSIASYLATAGSDDPVTQNIEQSLWYRQPLSNQANGQMMVGAYYLSNPQVYDLVNEPGSMLAQGMKAGNVAQTTTEVNTATTYYHNQQNGLATAEGTAPEIGTVEQYSSGALPSAYTVIMCNQKINSGQDPDGKYAKLKNHVIHFTNATKYYNTKHTGTQPIGGTGGVLEGIAAIDPNDVHDYVMNNGPYEIVDPRTKEIVEYYEPQPLDMEELQVAYAMKAASWNSAESSGGVDGTFTDTGISVSLTVSGNLTAATGGGVQCAITEIKSIIGDLHIKLSQEAGWWPGLYDKVTNWIANSFMTSTIKDKLNDQLNSKDMRDKLAEIINGGLKNL
jgi:hypothetical protein